MPDTTTHQEVLTSIVIALVSGVSSAILTSLFAFLMQKSRLKHEERSRRRDIFSQRGEELFELLTKVSASILPRMMQAIIAFQGPEREAWQAFEFLNSELGRIQMLVNLYYPELLSELSTLNRASSSMRSVAPRAHQDDADPATVARAESDLQSAIISMRDHLKETFTKSLWDA